MRYCTALFFFTFDVKSLLFNIQLSVYECKSDFEKKTEAEEGLRMKEKGTKFDRISMQVSLTYPQSRDRSKLVRQGKQKWNEELV